jgi:cytoskeletal protein RodZ
MGVSLQSAAAETHLRESYLAALERDDIGHLDLDPAYVRGTLRTYADYLGLDSDTLVARLRAITPPPEVRAPATVSVVERRQTTRDALWLAVGAAGLALIAVIGFTLGETLALYTTRPASVGASGGSGASAREPTAPSERATALPGRRHPRPFGTERSPVTKPSGAPVAATEAPGRPLELELEFIRSTWVRV